MYADTSTFTHTDSSRTLFYSLGPSSSGLMNEWEGVFIFCSLHCIVPVADSYKYEQIMLQTLHIYIKKSQIVFFRQLPPAHCFSITTYNRGQFTEWFHYFSIPQQQLLMTDQITSGGHGWTVSWVRWRLNFTQSSLELDLIKP